MRRSLITLCNWFLHSLATVTSRSTVNVLKFSRFQLPYILPVSVEYTFASSSRFGRHFLHSEFGMRRPPAVGSESGKCLLLAIAYTRDAHDKTKNHTRHAVCSATHSLISVDARRALCLFVLVFCVVSFRRCHDPNARQPIWKLHREISCMGDIQTTRSTHSTHSTNAERSSSSGRSRLYKRSSSSSKWKYTTSVGKLRQCLGEANVLWYGCRTQFVWIFSFSSTFGEFRREIVLHTVRLVAVCWIDRRRRRRLRERNIFMWESVVLVDSEVLKMCAWDETN